MNKIFNKANVSSLGPNEVQHLTTHFLALLLNIIDNGWVLVARCVSSLEALVIPIYKSDDDSNNHQHY